MARYNISNYCIFCNIFLTVFSVTAILSYKIPDPIPVVRNAALEYKGPVFIIKETEDPGEPFVGLIAEGGIELVKNSNAALPPPNAIPQPPLPPPPKPQSGGSYINTPVENSEDPEYFAVLVTPETVAQAQISRTTTITLPLTLLLIGASSRIPWLMVLKKDNHYEYFKTLQALQAKSPLRRRGRVAEVEVQNPAVFSTNDSNSTKLDLVYYEQFDEKDKIRNICQDIVKELMRIHHKSPVNTSGGYYNGYNEQLDEYDFGEASTSAKKKQVEESIPIPEEVKDGNDSSNRIDQKQIPPHDVADPKSDLHSRNE